MLTRMQRERLRLENEDGIFQCDPDVNRRVKMFGISSRFFNGLGKRILRFPGDVPTVAVAFPARTSVHQSLAEAHHPAPAVVAPAPAVVGQTQSSPTERQLHLAQIAAFFAEQEQARRDQLAHTTMLIQMIHERERRLLEKQKRKLQGQCEENNLPFSQQMDVFRESGGRP